MRVHEVSFPLYLNNKDLIDQIETIGMAFNKYNNDINVKVRSFRCCSIALNKTKIVSIGINRAKTSPQYEEYAKRQKLTIHAEIDMIMNIERAKDFKKVTDIYIIRGYSQLLPSMPCPLCASYLAKKFKSKTRINYYTESGWASSTLEELALKYGT